jgi:hypothetical protein
MTSGRTSYIVVGGDCYDLYHVWWQLCRTSYIVVEGHYELYHVSEPETMVLR